jgi:hypothetical protein
VVSDEEIDVEKDTFEIDVISNHALMNGGKKNELKPNDFIEDIRLISDERNGYRENVVIDIF